MDGQDLSDIREKLFKLARAMRRLPHEALEDLSARPWDFVEPVQDRKTIMKDIIMEAVVECSPCSHGEYIGDMEPTEETVTPLEGYYNVSSWHPATPGFRITFNSGMTAWIPDPRKQQTGKEN